VLQLATTDSTQLSDLSQPSAAKKSRKTWNPVLYWPSFVLKWCSIPLIVHSDDVCMSRLYVLYNAVTLLWRKYWRLVTVVINSIVFVSRDVTWCCPFRYAIYMFISLSGISVIFDRASIWFTLNCEHMILYVYEYI
jgi:hypothetical protein